MLTNIATYRINNIMTTNLLPKEIKIICEQTNLENNTNFSTEDLSNIILESRNAKTEILSLSQLLSLNESLLK
jgi:hypothetical protein